MEGDERGRSHTTRQPTNRRRHCSAAEAAAASAGGGARRGHVLVTSCTDNHILDDDGIEGRAGTATGGDDSGQEQHPGGHIGDQPRQGEAEDAGAHGARVGCAPLRRSGGIPAQGLRSGGREERKGKGGIDRQWRHRRGY